MVMVPGDLEHLRVASYPALFAVVAAESSGVPIPGETALIAAALLASRGGLSIELVIAVAALAAIAGDNIGYLIGRRGGRWLLLRPGRLQSYRRRALETGEPFFERHGPKAVFFGRWFAGLRIWASWLAGAMRMRWSSFLLWNALGGIAWALSVGLAAYLLGHAAARAFTALGLAGLATAIISVVIGALLVRRVRRTQ